MLKIKISTKKNYAATTLKNFRNKDRKLAQVFLKTCLTFSKNLLMFFRRLLHLFFALGASFLGPLLHDMPKNGGKNSLKTTLLICNSVQKYKKNERFLIKIACKNGKN
jgi:hypothetical protein